MAAIANAGEERPAAPKALTRAAMIAVALLVGLAIIPRLLIYWSIQFPAPSGDAILFASVSSYHCREGVFLTPIFPLDPSGEYKYIWHAIGQPAVISLLNFDCSNAGLFIALTAVIVLTVAISFLLLASRVSFLLWMAFILALFALQVKQGFRPETLAIPVVLLLEHFRAKVQSSAWICFLLLLAWIHPTVFILHAAYSLCTMERAQWDTIVRTSKTWIPMSAGVTLALVALYPFKISELLNGIVLQGKLFSQRTDGSLFTYYIRSDFFPMFGLAFAGVYLMQVWRHKALILMAPMIWFYAVRVPPAYYNIVPLFVALLHGLLLQPRNTEQSASRPGDTRQGAGVALGLVGILAWAGITQGNLRDLHSYSTYHATLSSSIARYRQLESEGATVCKVPPFFSLFLPSTFFAPSYDPGSRQCGANVGAQRSVDLVAGSLGAEPNCVPWARGQEKNVLDSIYKTDSGYSFSECKAAGR